MHTDIRKQTGTGFVEITVSIALITQLPYSHTLIAVFS